MAIEHTDKTDGQLDRRWFRTAAAASMLAVLAGIILLVVRLAVWKADFGEAVYACIWIAVLVLAAG
ncbi:MAG: hypothetical protein NTV86_05825, partial [Planctomycetota bacterium]|nr:hypothetical protein [Planctomycetota bacterium]